MSDDVWRRRGHDDAEDEFGGPLFGDDLGRAGGDAPRRSRRGADGGGGALSFGDHDAEPLPHWTAPPTGEIPDVLVTDQHAVHHEDVDVWSTFSDQGPAWEEEPTNPQYDSAGNLVPTRIRPADAGFGAATNAFALRSMQAQIRFQF